MKDQKLKEEAVVSRQAVVPGALRRCKSQLSDSEFGMFFMRFGVELQSIAATSRIGKYYILGIKSSLVSLKFLA
jgi:hypothetical protein